MTPKKGGAGRQPRAVAAPLRDRRGADRVRRLRPRAGAHDPSTINNVAFVALHVSVLLAGIWPALVRPRVAAAEAPEEPAHLEVQAA